MRKVFKVFSVLALMGLFVNPVVADFPLPPPCLDFSVDLGGDRDISDPYSPGWTDCGDIYYEQVPTLWKDDEAPVTWNEILEIFGKNVNNVIALLTNAIKKIK